MPNYRRRFVPGGCWSFAVNLFNRRSSLLVDHIAALREATRWTMPRYPFRIDAFVMLPEHLHAIWTLPPGDADFSTRWRMIKTRLRDRSRTSSGARRHAPTRTSAAYWAINPVKHGWVRRLIDWPCSSFHRDVRRGVFTEDWGADIDLRGEFGSGMNRRRAGKRGRAG